MTKRESILRYILIIRKLRNFKYCTFQEINDYLQSEGEIHGYNLSVSKRTFQRDKNDIRSIFNMDIQFDSMHNKYFIEEEPDDSEELSHRMLEAFDLFNSLNLAQGMKEIISVETRKALGTEHVYGLMHAIKNRHKISFFYYKYDEEKLTERVAEPLHLKEFKYRWYLIANDINGRNKTMKTFALDRMSGLDILKEKFAVHEKLDFKAYFFDAFGIIKPTDKGPRKVVLSFDPLQGQYIKSLKLHHSQKVLINNNTEYRVQLKVYITWDFIQELMMFANTMTVIEPLELRAQIKRICRGCLELNKGSG